MVDASPRGSDDAPHVALLMLHRMAGTVKGGSGRFAPMPTGEALAHLANAPDDMVTPSARLDVLGALARADFPGDEHHRDQYLAVAESVGGRHGVAAEQILDDMKAAAEDPGTFAGSPTARALPHELTAFFMQDVCSIHEVDVDGKRAVWIFSEFETDAPLEQVAAWVDPVNWPERSPQMFKKMEPVDGPPTAVPGPPGVTQWYAIFHEQVQLVERLDTLLSCAFYEAPGTFAGMSYDLDHSEDDQIDVDRGFLLVVDLGETRHVKALKIVGFTDPIWDDVAQWVCPFWTDFVRGAARGGTTTRPHPQPGETPSEFPGGQGGLDPTALVKDWMDFVAEAVGDYSEMAIDWMSAVTGGRYGPTDIVRDGARMWSQLARDWARAWAKTMATLDELSEAGVDVSRFVPTERTSRRAAEGDLAKTMTAPGASTAGGSVTEATTLPMPGFDPSMPFTWKDFVRIGMGGAAIPGRLVRVRAASLPDLPAVHIALESGAAAPGLYLSEITAGRADEFCKAVQLYVSGARRLGGSSG